MFVTPPRTWKRNVDAETSDLARYSRTEHATPDPAWIAEPRATEAGNGGEGALEALKRWLRGDDAALEEWLGATPAPGKREVRTTG
jgi:hypothetical protein